MKIQCNVCEAAEANVLCCADEAALCYTCDEKVHAANKLASKHQRVSLSNSSSPMPKCDICQETVGYFFCLEDRALLCRKCDVAIHSVNTYVSAHQRFLLTGVKVELETAEHSSPSSSGKYQPTKKVLDTESRVFSRKDVQMSIAGQQNKGLPVQAAGVGDFVPTKLPFAGGSASGSIQQWQLEPTECSAPSSIGKSQSTEKVREIESRPLSRKVAQMSLAGQHSKGLPVQVAGVYDFAPTKLHFAGGSASESIQQWQLDEIFGLTDLDQNNSYLDNVSSKADSGKLGDSDCSPILRAPEIALDGDECLGQVPEAARAVPEIPSPPTNSGLNWPKSYQHQMETALAFVPDVCCSPMQNPCYYQTNGSSIKRRRQF